MTLQAKRLLYPVADALLGAYGAQRARWYDVNQTIVVASPGRSGSTWLAEIVSTLPGHPVLWEPLHLKNNPECVDYGFTWQNYIPRGTDAEVKRHYLESILTGRSLSTRITSSLSFDPLRLLFLRGYVVKFVNANLLLGWLLDAFPLRTVLMVRHPCAVVSSQMTHGAWVKVTKETCTIPEGLFEAYPAFEEVFESLRSPEEVLAFEWAIQTQVPLLEPRPHPWHFTTYEWMVTRGSQEVERLFAYLGEPAPAAAYDRLHAPSATTAADSQVATGGNRLTGWQHKLTSPQIEAILRVARRMGADYYTDALLPDPARLPAEGVVLEGSR